jgi:cellulose synthase/poly-beta-1,6-N-acetylglucosamine synthase-like glycosyltransferase
MIGLYILLAVTIILFVPYAAIISMYRIWFLKLKPFTIPLSYQPKSSFTIIIPARNEEKNIGICIEGILKQNYPNHLFEIIVVDDYSTDNTANIIEQIQKENNHLRLIQLAKELHHQQLNSYKKKAIELAINKSNYDWIITTDADCIIQTNWLKNFDAYIQQTNAVFIGAPVVFSVKNTILSMFQYIDFIGMQTITAAAVSAGFHSMCNGANLAYKKNVFFEVNGFKGIDTIASGDDMLLMNKIKNKHPDKIGFLFSKEAIVTTAPMPSWRSFLNQRIRWASKAKEYQDKTVYWVLWLVQLLNMFLLLVLMVGLFKPIFLLYGFALIILKTIIELLFMIPAQRFFSTPFLQWFLWLQPLHIMYIVIAGWLGIFGKYQWKGRMVK